MPHERPRRSLGSVRRFKLIDEKRPVSYAIVFGVWLEVFLWSILHDQYLIRIAPEHFTVHHPPLWNIDDLTLLATAWAFRGTIGPGLVLGVAALFAARSGPLPKLAPAELLKTLPVFILATEAAGLAAGFWSWTSGRPLYPAGWYPDASVSILVSQSIQLTCYLAGPLFCFFFLIAIVQKRRRMLSGQTRVIESIPGA